MHDFGWVHAQFACYADFTDDELCLLHFPEPPWFAVSEPLVNLRYALEQQQAVLGLEDAACGRLLAALSALWFGDRTEARLRLAMQDDAGFDPATAKALLAWMRGHRIKAIDLHDLLKLAPWRSAP